MDAWLMEVRAGVFVTTWRIAAEESEKYHDKAVEISSGWTAAPTEKQLLRRQRPSLLSRLIERGGGVELARLMTLWYQEAGEFKLSVVLEYLEEVLEDMKAQVTNPENPFDNLVCPYSEEDDKYLDVFLASLEPFALAIGGQVVVFVSHTDAGYIDSVYWNACIRIYDHNDEFVDLPFYRVSSHFDSREAGESFSDVYGLPVEFEESTQEMEDDNNRFASLESNNLDITNVESLIVLVNTLNEQQKAWRELPIEEQPEALLNLINEAARADCPHPDLSVMFADAVRDWDGLNDEQRFALCEDYIDYN